jgi:hypothetical protein
VARKIVALVALVALAAALVTACGGTDQDSQGRSLYHAYRAAEDSRTDTEEELRLVFADISRAAANEDRDAVLAAANRGKDAAAEIDRLLASELEAANGLAGIEPVGADAKRLAQGIELTRQGLDLEAEELDVALQDPFLATRADEVKELARRSTSLAIRGELAVRRADRAIALALGIQPRPDRLATTG